MIKTRQNPCAGLPFYASLAIWFLTLITIGCSVSKTIELEKITPNSPSEAELKKLESGYGAFLQKDYEKASYIFDSLFKYGKNGEIRRRSLYGLTCARLMIAKNRDEFNEAVNLWNAWVQSAPGEHAKEDPRLLEPFLKSRAFVSMDEKWIEKEGKSEEKIDYLEIFRKKEEKIDNLEVIRKKEKIIQYLTKIIETMKKEIKTLKHQITAMEAIDQKIEKKKKEISSP